MEGQRESYATVGMMNANVDVSFVLFTQRWLHLRDAE